MCTSHAKNKYCATASELNCINMCTGQSDNWRETQAPTWVVYFTMLHKELWNLIIFKDYIYTFLGILPTEFDTWEWSRGVHLTHLVSSAYRATHFVHVRRFVKKESNYTNWQWVMFCTHSVGLRCNDSMRVTSLTHGVRMWGLWSWYSSVALIN